MVCLTLVWTCLFAFEIKYYCMIVTLVNSFTYIYMHIYTYIHIRHINSTGSLCRVPLYYTILVMLHVELCGMVLVLTWCLYFLASHQDVQDRVYKEMTTELAEDKVVTADNVTKLK